MDRVGRAKNTFQFDEAFTLKVLARDSSCAKYYQELSCSDVVESVERPVLFVQSKNDPICR